MTLFLRIMQVLVGTLAVVGMIILLALTLAAFIGWVYDLTPVNFIGIIE